MWFQRYYIGKLWKQLTMGKKDKRAISHTKHKQSSQFVICRTCKYHNESIKKVNSFCCSLFFVYFCEKLFCKPKSIKKLTIGISTDHRKYRRRKGSTGRLREKQEINKRKYINQEQHGSCRFDFPFCFIFQCSKLLLHSLSYV